MSIVDKKITDYNGKDVASAGDVLTGTAAENKAIFDALTKEVVVPAFNGLIDELTTIESDAYTHENKSVLDQITPSVKSGYDNAVNEAHNHANKSILDSITSEQINGYDIAYQNSHTHNNKTVLDGITANVKAGYDSAVESKHVHDNKAVLDGITTDVRAGYDNAVISMHTHNNKTVLDSITAGDIANYNNAFAESHTHANKSMLDSLDTVLNEYATIEYVDDAISAGGGQIVVDGSLSDTSVNPVQNKVITSALAGKASVAAEHTHTNKSILDSITESVKNGYDLASEEAHTHANKIVIDSITADVKTGYDSAVSNAHTHDNKSVLDGIDSIKIAGWNLGAQNNHTHANKAILDSITKIPKRTATLVIGNTAAGHTSADCDYLCTGTADHVMFNTAIAALPSSGGEIKVLEGTYQFTQGAANAVWIHCTKTNVKISGAGRSTIIRMVDSNSGVVSSGIRLSAVGCEVSNLAIDARGWVSTPGGGNPAVWLNANECRAENLYIQGYWNKMCIYASATARSVITGNVIMGGDNSSSGTGEINLASSASRSIATNNIITKGSDSSATTIINNGTGNTVVNNVV